MKIHSFCEVFESIKNTLRVSGVNSVAAKYRTIEVKGDHFLKR